ncbi:MAG: LacI family DNA-binding transcriptional regulator [Dermabacter sp.]|nr:LacI family DNA-binding transcriptional regulator [Dermabacter sp.]
MPEPTKRATSADVAKHAGVSRATVSMVLNNRTEGTVSTATRERVLRAASDLQYRRSRTALALKEQRTRTIGIVSDEIVTSPWAGRMIRSAIATASERGYVSLTADLSIAGATLEGAAHTFAERDVDGLVVASMGAGEVAIPATLPHVPLVLLNCRSADSPGMASLAQFMPDDAEGARRAARRLIDTGHRRIAMLAGDDASIANTSRIAGFAEVCRAAGVEATVVEAGWNFDDGHRAGLAVLDVPANQRPTAVFCIRDRVAAGFMLAAAHAGLEVPRDVSVIGFDDEDFFAECLVPPLTTMELPHVEMGRDAMTALLNEIEGEVGGERSVRYYPCPLVERASVGLPIGA